MPFCPKCKYEYREGIEVCPDCDVKLVPKLHEEEAPRYRDEPLADLGSTADEMELQLALGWLKEAGIPAVSRTREEGLPSVYTGVYSGLKTRIISVPASRLADAKRVLRSARKE